MSCRDSLTYFFAVKSLLFTGGDLQMDFDDWNIIWCLTFGVMAGVAIVGNIATIVIFLKRQLRKRPHFLLISLAAADLLVGVLAIPLYILLQYVDDEIEGSIVIPAIAEWTDMFTGFTSIFTLAVISLERMYAIGWPFRHRLLSTPVYIVAIATPWILSLVGASTAIVLQYVIVQPIRFIILLSVYLTTPIVFSCSAYFVLWKKERSRHMPHQVQEARDLKLTKTVALITGAFLVTWLPFYVLILVVNFCISCRHVSPVVVCIIKLLQYGNSVVNIVIYPARNADYRSALLDMLSPCKCTCRSIK